jgi:hypothetical protein
MSLDIKERIAAMGNLFVFEGLVKLYILATDSALLRSKGHVWHTSSMKEGIIPYSGIDTDARWGFSHTKGWVFGYKLHMISSNDSSVIVPLSATDVTTANVYDKTDLFRFDLMSITWNVKETPLHGDRSGVWWSGTVWFEHGQGISTRLSRTKI